MCQVWYRCSTSYSSQQPCEVGIIVPSLQMMTEFHSQQTFTDFLLHARHCAKGEGSEVSSGDVGPALLDSAYWEARCEATNYTVVCSIAMVVTALIETCSVHSVCDHPGGLIQMGVQTRLTVRPEV